MSQMRRIAAILGGLVLVALLLIGLTQAGRGDGGASSKRPFDLATDIPLRARIFRVTDDDHVLVTALHHIAADGLSIEPLVRDMSRSRVGGTHWVRSGSRRMG